MTENTEKCPVCGAEIENGRCLKCGMPVAGPELIKQRKEEERLAHQLYDSAVHCVQEAGYATTSLLQRRFHIGYAVSAILIDMMEVNGIVGPYRDAQPREVLVPCSDSFDIPLRPDAGDSPVMKAPNVSSSTSSPPPGTQKTATRLTLADLDRMEGHNFEYLCAAVLEANGFVNVTVTKASGDQGIDVLAEKSGSQYAIQCKCYNSPVGNHAVQEAFSGAAFYDGRIPVVMTNQVFTAAARELAAKIKVVLWDRGELERLLAIYNSVYYGMPVSARSPIQSTNCRNSTLSRPVRKMCKKRIALFLCLFLGLFGGHKFYEGKIGIGILYFFTFGLFGIGWIVDLILILCKPGLYPVY